MVSHEFRNRNYLKLTEEEERYLAELAYRGGFRPRPTEVIECIAIERLLVDVQNRELVRLSIATRS